MTDCKHDWHFIEGTERLRCERCKVETGPKTYEQRVKDFLQEPRTEDHGSTMSKKEEMALRELAGGRCTIQKVIDAVGPLSLWSKEGMELEIEKARQKELDACCDLLEGMHAATTGSHNYYLHAANELRKLRKGEEQWITG